MTKTTVTAYHIAANDAAERMYYQIMDNKIGRMNNLATSLPPGEPHNHDAHECRTDGVSASGQPVTRHTDSRPVGSGGRSLPAGKEKPVGTQVIGWFPD
jgi:hypothetical protein